MGASAASATASLLVVLLPILLVVLSILVIVYIKGACLGQGEQGVQEELGRKSPAI